MACRLLLLCVVLAVAGCRALSNTRMSASPLGGSARVEMHELPIVSLPDGLPVAPWVLPGDSAWHEGLPLFEMAGDDIDTAARGWVAVSAEAILLRVVVEDDVHSNDRHGSDIWDGDGLQIGVDALGDGAGDGPADARVVGPDDAELAIALTGDGPTVWAHYHGRPGGEGKLPQSYATIERDNDAGTTTYNIGLPWSEFQQHGGFSSLIGLRVQVNDTDPEGGRQGLNWGDRDNRTRPGLFNRLAVGMPPPDFATAAARQSLIWRRVDHGQIAFAIARPDAAAVRARMADLEETFSLPPASPAGGLRRFVVEGYPDALPSAPVGFEAELLAADGAVLAGTATELDAPVHVVDALQRRIDELAATSPHPLFIRHLRSTAAVVMAEWNRAMMMVDAGDQRAREAVDYAKRILEGLNGAASEWGPYARGERGMVFARISSWDQTVQYYSVSLPTGWDPEKAYPLVVDLHGAGPSHPLFYAALHFGPEGPQGEPAQEPLEPHFRLAPWGRGNRGYMEQAEDDVWEALADFKETFKVDEDRQYLTGHSMGGGGTWSIGLRTPDLWAAVCVVSGGTWSVPTGIGLGKNAAHLPVRIWHGDQDGAVSVDNAYRMQEELRQYGNEPVMVIAPGLGHSPPAEAWRENTQWLLQHKRARPDEFSFVCDGRRHRGVWGITTARDPHVSYQPEFRCSIEGQTVLIDSEGTPGLQVELGEGGLGLSGEVTVSWNGEEAYKGPATRVRLGEGADWR